MNEQKNNSDIMRVYDEQRLSITEFCQVVGISRQTFYSWKSGGVVAPDTMLELVKKTRHDPDHWAFQMASKYLRDTWGVGPLELHVPL